MTSLAVIGEVAFYLLYAWLLSAIAPRLGCPPARAMARRWAWRAGCSCVGIVAWLFWPAKPDSRWKVQGRAFGKKRGKTVAEARAEREAGESDGS